MLLPMLSEADPAVSSEGSIDPLGTSVVAEALAVQMIPGVRERQRHPRFLTAIAVSHALCDDYDPDEVASDHISEPWQVFEWYLVEGLVRTETERSRLTGLPGQDKAGSAVKDAVPLSAKRYLKTPSIFGFHGIYRVLARDIDLEIKGRMLETGARLLKTWEAEQGLHGFVGSGGGPGLEAKRRLREAIQDGLKKGATARSSGWQGWRFFRDHLGIYSIGPREAKVVIDALLDPARGHRGEILSFLTSHKGSALWRKLSENGGSEREFHRALRGGASAPLREHLDAIDRYERFSRLIEDAFQECLSKLSRRQGRIRSSELAPLASVKLAIASMSDLYHEVSARLPLGQAAKFREKFADVAEKLPPQDWVERLFEHHTQNQLAKPPAGKAPWVDLLDDASYMIRAAYFRHEFDGPTQEYVHAYRTASLWSFARDLHLVS